MKAGELTADYLGSTLTAHDVGQMKRTITVVLAAVQHDSWGHAGSYRTILTGDDSQVVMLPAGHEIELKQ